MVGAKVTEGDLVVWSQGVALGLGAKVTKGDLVTKVTGVTWWQRSQGDGLVRSKPGDLVAGSIERSQVGDLVVRAIII